MTSQSILDFSKRIKRNLRDHYQSGLSPICTLGEMDVKLIESLRVRSGHEKSYVEYFFEKFGESVNLLARPWTLENREHLSPEARSPYLDLLAQTFESVCQVPSHPAILDYNYYLYTQIGIDDEARWMRHLDDIKAQKILEREKIRAEAVCDGNADVGKKNIVALFNFISEKYGFQFEHKKKPSERLFLHKVLDEGRISLLVEDISGIKKWGQLAANYEFQCGFEDEASAVAVLSAASGFPGARWYKWKNTDLYDVHVSLNALAQALQWM